MQRFRSLLLRQYGLGKFGNYLGAYYVQLGNSMFWVGLWSTLMAMITVWAVKLESILGAYINFYEFLAAIVVVFALVVPLLDYKLLMKARCGYQTRQVWWADNPSREQLKRIEDRLSSIEKKLQ